MLTTQAPKILIVGNLGYIGSALIADLRKKYPKSYLTGFDIGYFSGCIFSPLGTSDYLLNEQLYGDVREFNYDLLDGIDSVVYLAAISNDPMGTVYAEETHEINALSAMRIAKEAKSRGVQTFIFASSCSIYGAGGGEIRTEDSEVRPLTPYARSKVDAENLLMNISDSKYIITCLRFATACGASPRLRFDLVLNDFVANALINKRIDILSDGTPWRPLIAVQDMCEGIDWAISRSADNGGPFLAINTGFSEWNFTVKDIAQMVGDVIPGTVININPTAQVDNRSYKVNFSLYQSLSGNISPRVNMKDTILELISLISESGFKDQNYRGSLFNRLQALSVLAEKGLLSRGLRWRP
jgi:nucleoside-diphosphate-sugar epimerase